MPVEIERKFLVASDSWRNHVQRSRSIVQGYFPKGDGYCVRIRIMDDRDAFLTIKNSARGVVARAEFEYSIPLEHAREMLRVFCGGERPRVISKVRHYIHDGGHTWEIDEFLGRHAPLVVAEIELAAAGEAFDRPGWLGQEVTGDYRYANEYLANGGTTA